MAMLKDSDKEIGFSYENLCPWFKYPAFNC